MNQPLSSEPRTDTKEEVIGPQNQSQNQNLLNLIHACKSVDQDQARAPQSQLPTLLPFAQQLKLAVQIHQRCLDRGGALPAPNITPPLSGEWSACVVLLILLQLVLAFNVVSFI